MLNCLGRKIKFMHCMLILWKLNVNFFTNHEIFNRQAMTSLILIKLTQPVFKNSKDSLGVSIKQMFFACNNCGTSKRTIVAGTS